ncbi:MAG: hypothetical protein D6785_03345 [Planctomycetota bacterium]|nr:MAG: hypothetical protein D6785_03345 [Planctomycetota bacterium]
MEGFNNKNSGLCKSRILEHRYVKASHKVYSLFELFYCYYHKGKKVCRVQKKKFLFVFCLQKNLGNLCYKICQKCRKFQHLVQKSCHIKKHLFLGIKDL